MRKCLAQLVADLRRLGATVVAADSASLILATGKRNLSAAVGYIYVSLNHLEAHAVSEQTGREKSGTNT